MYLRLQPRHCLDTIAINAPALDSVGLRTGDKVEFNIVDLDFVESRRTVAGRLDFVEQL